MFAIKIIILGKVHGVSFREKTRSKAQELGITGWVKINERQELIIYAEGSMESLIALTNWCQKGPKNSDVDKVSIEWNEKLKKDFIEFDVRR